MDLTFEQLNSFYEVARHLSFSKAGQELFRSQSAVSIQIARLEETLGQTLFHRTTKKTELTEAGRIFLRYVDNIKQLLKEAETELNDLEEMTHGSLIISTSDTTACYRLPHILQEYRTLYPGIDIIVRNATSLRTIGFVKNNEVDLGIVTLSYLDPSLTAVPLFSRSDVVICHPHHPLAGRSEVFLKDLEHYNCILLDKNCSSRRILDEALTASKVQLSITMELSSIEVIKSFVSIDSGISIVPYVSIENEIRAGQLVSLKINDFLTIQQSRMGVIYKKGRYLSIAAKKFLEMLRDAQQ